MMEELQDLQRKVMLFTTVTDRQKRWRAGMWAESQARQLDRRYRILDGFNETARVELSAIVKMIFDFLLYDKLEDEDWIEALPDHYDGDIEQMVRQLRQEAARAS